MDNADFVTHAHLVCERVGNATVSGAGCIGAGCIFPPLIYSSYEIVEFQNFLGVQFSNVVLARKGLTVPDPVGDPLFQVRSRFFSGPFSEIL